MTEAENKLLNYFETLIHMIDDKQTPDVLTFVVFINEDHPDTPYYIYPYKDEISEDFTIRSGALKKEIGSDITIVYNNNTSNKLETITMVHHDTKTIKMFNRTNKQDIEPLLGWFEVFYTGN